MSNTMTDKNRKRGRPTQKNALTVQISVRMSEEWANVLQAYCDSKRPSPERTDIMRVAMEDFLAAEGWTPETLKNKLEEQD